jgi:hypothetical protein
MPWPQNINLTDGAFTLTKSSKSLRNPNDRLKGVSKFYTD